MNGRITISPSLFQKRMGIDIDEFHFEIVHGSMNAIGSVQSSLTSLSASTKLLRQELKLQIKTNEIKNYFSYFYTKYMLWLLNETVLLNTQNICAATCDNQQCGILTSLDSDEPVHLP